MWNPRKNKDEHTDQSNSEAQEIFQKLPQLLKYGEGWPGDLNKLNASVFTTTRHGKPYLDIWTNEGWFGCYLEDLFGDISSGYGA